MRGLQRLGVEDGAAALAFCEKRPVECTFIAGWITDGGLGGARFTPAATLYGEKDPQGKIRSLAYLSATGIAMPVLDSESAVEAWVSIGTRRTDLVRVLVGERGLVEVLWARLRDRGFRARLIRNQQGYMIERGQLDPSAPRLSLEVGTRLHLSAIVDASGAMAREEAKDDPQGRNPFLFQQRVADRVERGRDFIYLEHGKLVFKCNVAALSNVGGQVEGIYTVPAFRRRGIALAGTASVTEWVLERSQRACLLVNDDNLGAQDLYKRLGYRESMLSQTIFLS